MEIRAGVIEDLPQLLSWWPAQRVASPPAEFIWPNLKIAFEGDLLIAMVSMYLDTHGLVAFIAYVASNPKAGVKQKNVALTELILAQERHAAKLGYKIMQCFTPTQAISTRLMRGGYLPGDIGVKHYLKGIK